MGLGSQDALRWWLAGAVSGITGLVLFVLAARQQ
jgi:hypothetical protein